MQTGLAQGDYPVYNLRRLRREPEHHKMETRGRKVAASPKKLPLFRQFDPVLSIKWLKEGRGVGIGPKNQPLQGGERNMTLIKCPRCDLNYITPDQKYCKICMREMKGEGEPEEVELCSICNEQPALPGKDVCLFCLKEMNQAARDNEDTEEQSVDASNIGDMDDVSGMDEIIPEEDDDIPAQEFGEMEQELSLEAVREDEEREAEEAEEEEE